MYLLWKIVIFYVYFLKEPTNLIFKEIKELTKKIEDGQLAIINSPNVTTRDVNTIASIKIGYDYIMDVLKQYLNKGKTPLNSIGGDLNGSDILKSTKQHLKLPQ